MIHEMIHFLISKVIYRTSLVIKPIQYIQTFADTEVASKQCDLVIFQLYGPEWKANEVIRLMYSMFNDNTSLSTLHIHTRVAVAYVTETRIA